MTPKMKTFLQRGFSTIVLLALLAGAVCLNEPIGYGILICLFCNLTTIEWFNMLRERKEEANRPLVLIGGLLYPWLMAAWLRSNGSSVCGDFSLLLAPATACLIVYTLLAFFCELFRMDYRGRSGAQALASMGITLLAFVYPVWLFAFSLAFISNVRFAVPFLLWVILVTKMSDIWAYCSGVLLGGRIFGERRFSPVVSPKKTWEGIIGSFILTVIAGSALAIPLLEASGRSLLNCALASVVIFALAVPGDLAGSLIKRGLAVKDSGSLLPGIGGIFDLIDSPAFTVSACMVLTAFL